MNVTQEQVDNIVSAFNDSFLANFIPNLDTEHGQDLLEEVAQYVLSCGMSMALNCPGLWLDYALHKIALTFVNWNITLSDSGVIIQTPESGTQVQAFLKTRMIGEKTCTFEQVKQTSNNSGLGAAASWRVKCEALEATCEAACSDIFMGGGSYLPYCETTTPCKGGC